LVSHLPPGGAHPATAAYWSSSRSTPGARAGGRRVRLTAAHVTFEATDAPTSTQLAELGIKKRIAGTQGVH
jgi:hypothetical protein